ncbi:hypothetical protein WJX72_009407 [[Myrmecia] bisecta]|uniref:Uncharacterized protein n=1 Tax=[Myrmecia] bisecta TaxID=41462 RepID=A0AAW1R8A7_9CHLO
MREAGGTQAGLQAELKQQADQVIKLTSEVTALTTSQKEVESALNDRQAEVQTLKDANESAVQQQQKAAADLQAAQSALTAAEQRATAAEQRATAAEQRAKQADNTLQELRTQLEALKQRLQSSQGALTHGSTTSGASQTADKVANAVASGKAMVEELAVNASKPLNSAAVHVKDAVTQAVDATGAGSLVKVASVIGASHHSTGKAASNETSQKSSDGGLAKVAEAIKAATSDEETGPGLEKALTLESVKKEGSNEL